MKVKDVAKGDQLVSSGTVIYTVTSVDHSRSLGVVARVTYRDGGPGERVWPHDTDVPLQRPA